MVESRQFADRTDAGERLGAELRERGIDADVVLAVPRGGLPLGRAVADALDAPLDVVVAKKVGAPENPEFALGAVASDGSVWRNESALGEREEEYFRSQRERVAEEARHKAERYRDGRPAPDLSGAVVVVVDDGIATGATARACLRKVRADGAERVVLAVPVGPPETVRELEAETDADEVVCLLTPALLGGVGRFYEQFDQVTDEEAMTYLDAR